MTPRSFDLSADTPTVTVHCTISKRRKQDRVILTKAAAAALRPFVESVPQDQQLWPHKWYRRGADMLKLDLGAAGLNPETVEGVLDFHSTRHTFVTNLAKSGASDREIMLIARLSTSTLVSRYAHPDATSQQAVVERLSPPPVLAASEVRGEVCG